MISPRLVLLLHYCICWFNHMAFSEVLVLYSVDLCVNVAPRRAMLFRIQIEEDYG